MLFILEKDHRGHLQSLGCAARGHLEHEAAEPGWDAQAVLAKAASFCRESHSFVQTQGSVGMAADLPVSGVNASSGWFSGTPCAGLSEELWNSGFRVRIKSAPRRRSAMRPRALVILVVSVMFATLPAFAQMTQQNRQNQGNAANPPLTSGAKQGNASATGVTSGPAAGSPTASNTAVPKQSWSANSSAGATGAGAPGTPAKPGTEAGAAPQKPASQ
jgi:hypothetical protein